MAKQLIEDAAAEAHLDCVWPEGFDPTRSSIGYFPRLDQYVRFTCDAAAIRMEVMDGDWTPWNEVAISSRARAKQKLKIQFFSLFLMRR